jgi:hypothetical protein
MRGDEGCEEYSASDERSSRRLPPKRAEKMQSRQAADNVANHSSLGVLKNSILPFSLTRARNAFCRSFC